MVKTTAHKDDSISIILFSLSIPPDIIPVEKLIVAKALLYKAFAIYTIIL